MHMADFFQLANVTADQGHVITEAVALGVAVGANNVWSHLKGKKRDRSMSKEFREIKDSVHEVKSDIKDLKAYVVGPDGSNGIRADVRDLKSDMNRLKEKGAFNTPPEFPAEKPARYAK